MSHVVVTGGAGFIGSHIVKYLCEQDNDVTVIDNFSCGFQDNLAHCDQRKLSILEIDLRNYNDTVKAMRGAEIVFHLAADPDVKSSIINPAGHYENNIQVTYNVLEGMRQEGVVPIVFTSSSVVYGEADVIPTPEDYPLHPISIYGSTKLACEVMINGYTAAFNIRALMLRQANIIGKNGTHGVILDFINKLKSNPKELEILGDGTQQKSYLHASDFVRAVMQGYQYFERNNSKSEIYNVGNLDSLNVIEIAKLVVAGMGLKDTELKLTGGVDGGRGWIGDVKTMLLSIDKLEKIGWQPSMGSNSAVVKTISESIS